MLMIVTAMVTMVMMLMLMMMMLVMMVMMVMMMTGNPFTPHQFLAPDLESIQFSILNEG